MSKSKIHIGFMNIGGSDWPGGTSYLRNLFIALRSLPAEEQPIISLLLPPQNTVDNSLRPYIDQVFEIPAELRPNRFHNALLRRLLVALARILFPRSRIGKFIKAQGVDVLFSTASIVRLQSRFDVALLIWLPDFQHRHLPELFSPRTLIYRDNNFREAGLFADRVVLSSQNALEHYAEFFPKVCQKARVLSFVSSLPEDVYQQDSIEICQQYNLPERFVYLPNQFWKHKNHTVVIEALRLACKEDPRVTIVCTGAMHDSRDPGYLPSLFTRLSEDNMRNKFIILGLIPYRHLIQLMRQSLAILQPSNYEGWSTIVEEAKSLGKSIILSDLSVHFEQDPPDGSFFDRHDADALAQELVRVFAEKEPGPDFALEAKANEMLPMRLAEFGEKFIEIVKDVV